MVYNFKTLCEEEGEKHTEEERRRERGTITSSLESWERFEARGRRRMLREDECLYVFHVEKLLPWQREQISQRKRVRNAEDTIWR